MSHTITLTRNHQRVLIEALAISSEIKAKKLRNPSSIKLMNDYYLDAAQKIMNNNIACGKAGRQPSDNLFAWIKDQLYHSGDMSKTEFGQLALLICEAGAYNEYDIFCRSTIINTLFE